MKSNKNMKSYLRSRRKPKIYVNNKVNQINSEIIIHRTNSEPTIIFITLLSMFIILFIFYIYILLIEIKLKW